MRALSEEVISRMSECEDTILASKYAGQVVLTLHYPSSEGLKQGKKVVARIAGPSVDVEVGIPLTGR